MEALVAISLAGNIVQFTESIKNIVSTGKRLSQHGDTQRRIELEVIAQEIRKLASDVTVQYRMDATRIADDGEPIRVLTAMCKEVADELLEVLEKLKIKAEKGTSKRFLETFYIALQTEWKKEKIDELLDRIDRIQNNIQIHVSRESQQRILSELVRLKDDNQRLKLQRDEDISKIIRQVQNVPGKFESDVKGHFRSGDRTKISGPQALILARAASEGVLYYAEQTIIGQLRFDSIYDRYTTLRRAHDRTLTWLLDVNGQRSPAAFSDWCKSESDTFWVTGKPGSGKSTLMKFLCEDPRTTELLESWASPRRLVTANYFFWNMAKNKLQKSQEGLLRSLIYQILRQCPEFILKVHSMVAASQPCGLYEAKDWGHNITSISELNMILTTPALANMFEALCKLLTQSSIKLCLFIDGLDEYTGSSDDIIDLISRLTSPGNVKICLSSRPWNKFEKAYGSGRTEKLAMQDFNAVDITAYVKDNLVNGEAYQELEDYDLRSPELVHQIVSSANGVFLWVFLVVRSLKEGLENGDRIIDLQKRLSSYPTDLDEYFGRILFSDIDRFYRRQSAEMFLVTLGGYGDLPLLAYWYMGEEENEPDYAMKMKSKQLSIQLINARLKTMRTRLNTYSKGLLEDQFVMPSSDSESLPSSVLFNVRVCFLHRTVRDYLLLETTNIRLREWCKRDFDPHETIAKALLAQVKVSPCGHEYRGTNGPVPYLCATLEDHCKATSRPTSNILRELKKVSGPDRSLDNTLRSEMPTIQLSGSRLSHGERGISTGQSEQLARHRRSNSRTVGKVVQWLSKLKSR
ncbi:Coproporphyrinogen-III oxidase [Hypoxylon texense]